MCAKQQRSTAREPGNRTAPLSHPQHYQRPAHNQPTKPHTPPHRTPHRTRLPHPCHQQPADAGQGDQGAGAVKGLPGGGALHVRGGLGLGLGAGVGGWGLGVGGGWLWRAWLFTKTIPTSTHQHTLCSALHASSPRAAHTPHWSALARGGAADWTSEHLGGCRVWGGG